MFIHLIADFGQGDLAFAEVAQRLKYLLPQAEPVLTPVPPFSTLAAGLCVAQLGLNPAPADTLIFHNVAPRRDNQAARRDNDGERLVYASLPNGVKVVGVNAGYAFSFVKNAATDLRFVNVASAGSQFRSRDIFPQAVAAVAQDEPDILGETVPPQLVPELPTSSIAYIDGFGNIKTTIQLGHYAVPPGSKVRVKIGEVVQEATVSDGSFSVPQGELAFSPGSSGWTLGDGREVRWMELFLRGGSAARAFCNPQVGDELEVLLVDTYDVA